MTREHLKIDKVKFLNNGNGVVISWSTNNEANIEFGELTLYQSNEDDKWKADTEYMCTNEDKEFIRMVLNKWVDDMEVEE